MKRLDYNTPMTYHKKMELIETPVFKKQIDRLLDELTYAQFKEYLVCNPLKGKLIRGGGGIRKIRWGKKNTGKSGGIRIIYFIKTDTQIYSRGGFNTPTLCVVIKGIKARLQPPYENNIPRCSASGLLIYCLLMQKAKRIILRKSRQIYWRHLLKRCYYDWT